MRELNCRGSNGDADAEYLKSVIHGEDENTQSMLKAEADYYESLTSETIVSAKTPIPGEAEPVFEDDRRDDEMIKEIASLIDRKNAGTDRECEIAQDPEDKIDPEDEIDFSRYLSLI